MSNTSTTSNKQTELESYKQDDNNFVDQNIIDWDGADDPVNPRNWSSSKKWAHVVLISIFALVTNMAPTMCAPGIDQVVDDFSVDSDVVTTLAVTLYVLGLAIGPMFISPLSELYGRLFVYQAANLIFIAFVVGNALSKDIVQFMVFRFISGCAGGTPMTLGGGTIADVTSLERRAIAMALFSLGPLAGPVLGPVIGGFIAADKSWRWNFWILAILSGSLGLISLFIMRETHPNILLEQKTAHLRAITNNPQLRSRLANPLLPSQVLVQTLFRPTTLLLRSPVLLVISLYVALVFGVMYLLFTTFPAVFEGQYDFPKSVSGLAYLGLGAALVTSMAFSTMLNRRRARVKTSPEDRLLPMIWFSPCAGLGLIIYGWTAYYRVHWIVPILGTVGIGIGAFFIIMPAQLYLIDIFGSEAAASALGANNLLRYISSTFLPLAGPAMYERLGYGWGNTLLGFLALAFVPGPVLFYRFGERLRDRLSPA